MQRPKAAWRVHGRVCDAKGRESEDWREYRETYEALRDQARCVELLVVIGVDGSVSTTALREIVDITVEQNGGRAMRVDLNPKPSTLWRVLHNGPPVYAGW